jgi:apolipoprotein N-acyltransferase
VLLAAGSGALTSLAFAPLEWWPVALVALVPLLVALRRTTNVRAAGWLALIWGVSFHATSLHWLVAIFGAAVPAILVITALPWYLFGAGYRLVHRALPRVAVIAAPILWLAVDWIRCEGWYFEFSWAQLGLAPVPLLDHTGWGIGFYPALGVYGVTFLIVLLNSLVTTVIAGPRDWVFGLAFLPLFAAAFLVFGASVQANVADVARTAAVVQHGHGDLDALARLTHEGAEQGADLIAWPESAVTSAYLDDAELRSRLSDLAREVSATLVVGGRERAPEGVAVDWLRRHAMEVSGRGLFYNSALVIAPDGDILGSYQKTHPIQFFADGIPGSDYPVFNTSAGRIGVAICYDFNYASVARKLVGNRAKVIVVPTMDSPDWPEVQHIQHARIAQARAAEAVCPVIRPATFGISQIISENGRVRASIPSGEVGVALAKYEFTDRDRRPVIEWPWLPHVCLGLSLLLLALAIGLALRGRQREAGGEQ